MSRSRAEHLNDVLGAHHPGALAMSSPLARRTYMPLGIPQQSEQARGARLQATIGQITRGDGSPLALPSLARNFPTFDTRQSLLYAPQYGLPELRQRWRGAILEGDAPTSVPVVTAGITHALSIAAELFTHPGAPLVVGVPYWDNYELIFALKTGCAIVTYPLFDAEGRFNLRGLLAAVRSVGGPCTVLLNFPSNPTGYSPYPDEAEAIVAGLAAVETPLAVICDDAYNGLYFDARLYGRSLFGALATALDPARAIAVKVDGATKELVFFGGRIGFVTFSATGPAADALEERAALLVRASISMVSAPAQLAVLDALRSPTLSAERRDVFDVLESRYAALREATEREQLTTYPYNSGCFALIPVRDDQDCDVVRRRLIEEQSVGVIAIPQVNAIRVAFCSMEAEDIPELVRRVAAVVRG